MAAFPEQYGFKRASWNATACYHGKTPWVDGGFSAAKRVLHSYSLRPDTKGIKNKQNKQNKQNTQNKQNKENKENTQNKRNNTKRSKACLPRAKPLTS